MSIKLSVIIPIYNEGRQLVETVQQLHTWVDEEVEVLFVDGANQEDWQSYLTNEGFQVASSLKGRGIQLALGAKLAKADQLLFLHADSYFTKSPKAEINRCLEKGLIGAFPLTFSNLNGLMRWVAWGSNWRLRYRQIAFGDQGIFVRRSYYESLGGFKSIPLMEDYDFSIRNRKNGVPLQIANQKIVTSDRRFKKSGQLKTLFKMQYCQWLFRRNTPIEEIIKIYHRKVDK